MPNSNLSGYSTASKHEIARINAENAKKELQNAAELARKDAEMNQIKVQMAEMAKIINNMQQQAPTESAVTPTNPRGRGRGQNSARGGHVGRGVGRGRGRLSSKLHSNLPFDIDPNIYVNPLITVHLFFVSYQLLWPKTQPLVSTRSKVYLAANDI